MSQPPSHAAVAAAEEILATLQAGEPYGESLVNHPVREIAAIIDRHIPATDRAGWQPIETAPKDGTWILLLHENHSTPTVGRWIDGGWFSDDGLKWPSTHWMPLPAAPTPNQP